MGQIFTQVGQAFVQAIPTIIAVALLVFILRRLFFRPLAAILKTREEESKGALLRARERASQAERRTEEYEAGWQTARLEVYALREADRRTTLADREEMIGRARAHAGTMIQEAEAALDAESEAARRELSGESASLAEEIVNAILKGPGGDQGAERSL
jgi:F-type H+-transporting ATPase subunit b